jgi:hypothetical protein
LCGGDRYDCIERRYLDRQSGDKVLHSRGRARSTTRGSDELIGQLRGE